MGFNRPDIKRPVQDAGTSRGDMASRPAKEANRAGAVLPTAVLVDHIQVADVNGIPIPIPRQTIRSWLRKGLRSVTIKISLDDLTLEDLNVTPPAALPVLPPAKSKPTASRPSLDTEWISIRDAARQLCRRLNALQVPGDEPLTLDHARQRIMYALRGPSSPIVSTGDKGRRSVSRDSVEAWIETQVARALDAIE